MLLDLNRTVHHLQVPHDQRCLLEHLVGRSHVVPAYPNRRQGTSALEEVGSFPLHPHPKLPASPNSLQEVNSPGHLQSRFFGGKPSSLLVLSLFTHLESNLPI